MEGGWAAPGKAGGEGEKPGKWSEMRARGRKGDLKSAAEEWETLRKREQSQLTHTHVCVCAGNSPSASCLEPFLTGVSSNSPAQLGSVRK